MDEKLTTEQNSYNEAIKEYRKTVQEDFTKKPTKENATLLAENIRSEIKEAQNIGQFKDVYYKIAENYGTYTKDDHLDSLTAQDRFEEELQKKD